MNEERRGFGLLGMQNARRLVGATVQIESAPGEGTTIFVRTPTMPLPRVRFRLTASACNAEHA
jgi:signal transduction histidine kinase